MHLKEQLEMPYIASAMLGETTEWIAYPVNISTRSQSYSSSLENVNQIASNLLSIAKKFENSNCQAMSLPKSGEFEHMQTRFEMWKDGKEFIADAYIHISMKFDSNLQLWEKMKMVAEQLDKITEYSESFKSDKVNTVIFGARFNSSK